jgi:putative transposase
MILQLNCKSFWTISWLFEKWDNRLINVIIEIYKPKRIIVERLDFRSPELSKELNRLIQNFGKRYIKQKLERLQELYGIEIIEINPAYTSQECSCYGYADKACGNKTNAQVNGAKNILKRSSLRSLCLTKKQVLKILIERYLERLKGCKSPPLDVVKGNPYFKDYLYNILNPCQSWSVKLVCIDKYFAKCDIFVYTEGENSQGNIFLTFNLLAYLF